MEKNKGMWWRYPLATLAFIAICLSVPFLVFIVVYLMEIISPEYYKAGELWLWLISYVLGAYMGYTVAFAISKGKEGFATTLSILYAVYAIVVGTINATTWGELPDATIAYILSGVAIIGFHIFRLMKQKKETKEEKVNEANSNGHNT